LENVLCVNLSPRLHRDKPWKLFFDIQIYQPLRKNPSITADTKCNILIWEAGWRWVSAVLVTPCVGLRLDEMCVTDDDNVAQFPAFGAQMASSTPAILACVISEELGRLILDSVEFLLEGGVIVWRFQSTCNGVAISLVPRHLEHINSRDFDESCQQKPDSFFGSRMPPIALVPTVLSQQLMGVWLSFKGLEASDMCTGDALYMLAWLGKRGPLVWNIQTALGGKPQSTDEPKGSICWQANDAGHEFVAFHMIDSGILSGLAVWQRVGSGRTSARRPKVRVRSLSLQP
jgi:hypothetical protein